jgi:putative tricarboxylic transport membrane protein
VAEVTATRPTDGGRRVRQPAAGTERVTAIVLLAASVAYTALAARLEEAFASRVFALGPRTFPLFVGAAGIVLALTLAVMAPEAGGPTPERPRPGGALAGDWRRVLLLCALVLLYAAALPLLGFTLSTVAFLAASFRLLGERRPLALVVVPIAVAGSALATMRGLLGVYLPEPLLEALFTRRG